MPDSRTPAESHWRISRRTLWSPMRSPRNDMSRSQSMLSKYPLMSTSRIQLTDRSVLAKPGAVGARRAGRTGRDPQLNPTNSESLIGSRYWLQTAHWAILSSIAAIPNARTPLSGLFISNRRTGFARLLWRCTRLVAAPARLRVTPLPPHPESGRCRCSAGSTCDQRPLH